MTAAAYQWQKLPGNFVPQIDWGSPQARDLVMWVHGAINTGAAFTHLHWPVDLRTGRFPTAHTGSGVLLEPNAKLGGASLRSSAVDTVLDFDTNGFSVKPITVCAWFRPTDTTSTESQVTLFEAADATNRIRILKRTSTDYRCQIRNSAGTTNIDGTVTSWDTSRWYHLAATWDAAGNMAIYLDGELGATGTQTGSPAGIDTFRLLANQSGGQHCEEIYDVRVYNRALAAAEIRSVCSRPHDLVWQPGPRRRAFVPAAGVTLTPTPASAIGRTAGPNTIILGPVTLTPNPASAIGRTAGPTVVLGSLSLTPTPSSAIGRTAGPGVVLGSLVITPTPASAIGRTVDPTVTAGGGVIVTPSPAAAIGAVAGPDVVLGSVTIAPDPAAAVGGVAGPSVVLGSISVTPAAAAVAIGSVAGPAVIITSPAVASHYTDLRGASGHTLIVDLAGVRQAAPGMAGQRGADPKLRGKL